LSYPLAGRLLLLEPRPAGLETNVHGADAIWLYGVYIRSSAARFGVEPWIVGAVVAQESNDKRYVWNASIFQPMNVEESIALLTGWNVGLGIGHMHVNTALDVQRAGFEPSASRNDTMAQLMDVATNIDYVAAYLSHLKGQFEEIGWTVTAEDLIAAYNVGFTARSEHRHGAIGQRYVKDVDRFKQAAQEHFQPRDPVRGPL
jgi:hypothetical protein